MWWSRRGLLLLLTLLTMAACGRIQNQGVSRDGDLSLDVTLDEADPLRVGAPAQLQIVVLDGDAPVEDATVAVEGTMTHAGMAPLLVEATPLGEGRYVTTLDWTMGGAWLVTVRATLDDGRTVERVIEGLEVEGN